MLQSGGRLNGGRHTSQAQWGSDDVAKTTLRKECGGSGHSGSAPSAALALCEPHWPFNTFRGLRSAFRATVCACVRACVGGRAGGRVLLLLFLRFAVGWWVGV